jgi:hypothetical protein
MCWVWKTYNVLWENKVKIALFDIVYEQNSGVPLCRRRHLDYYYYYYFQFIVAYYLLVGGLLVSPDLNKRSQAIYPSTLRIVCSVLMIAIFSSSVAGGCPGSNWRFWSDPFLIVPNAPFITGTVYFLTFHILLTSRSRSLYWLSISISIIRGSVRLCPVLVRIQSMGHLTKYLLGSCVR